MDNESGLLGSKHSLVQDKDGGREFIADAHYTNLPKRFERPDKYTSAAKAWEYTQMSWPHFATRPLQAHAFYDRLREILTDVARFAGKCDVIAEHGFGAGRMLREAARCFPDARVLGSEKSAEMRRQAESNFHEVRHGIARLAKLDLIEADVTDLPLVDEFADITVCINVLDRVSRTTLALTELIRTTRRGGVILLCSAFDYEPHVTPPEEMLTPAEMRRQGDMLGCELLFETSTTLVKDVDEANVIKFDEAIFVWRRNQ
jgi:SAM-dependent methyltransferase